MTPETNPGNFSVEDIFQISPKGKPSGSARAVELSAPATNAYTAVPRQLKELAHWVVWRTVVKEGKPTKIPFDAKTGAQAKANDSTTWATFEQAVAAANVLATNAYDGIGFELHGTNFVGIDFDNAINNKGVIDSYVLAILNLLGTPYTEVSPSGTGLHAFVSCESLPKGGRKMSKGHDGIEIYHGREAGRYFTMTGEQLLGTSVPVVADISLPYFLITQNKDNKFKTLWLGDTSAFDGDDSSADFALMCRLAALTQNDPVKMEKFFSASALGQREKWTAREDYRQRTINAAMEANHTGKTAPEELAFTLPAVVTTEANDNDYVLARILDKSNEGDDGWFPRGAVSLVGAPSGAGKTTTLYQLLLTQQCKGKFLGHDSFGLPFCVIGVDRGAAAHRRTMRRMRMRPDAIIFEGLALSFDFDAVQQIVVKIESYAAKHGTLPAIVLVEGVNIMVTKVNDIQSVSKFMNLLNRVAARYHVAIIGTLGAPKIKVGQGYTCLRDNVLGSGGWSRECEAMIIIQFPQGTPAATKGKRVMTVLLRNGGDERFTLGFNHGQLEQVPDIVEEESERTSTDVEWFQTQARLAKSDPTKRYWTVLDMHEATGMSESTVARHVGHALTKGYIKVKPGKKIGKGAAAQYQWNESETNSLWVAQQTQDVDALF